MCDELPVSGVWVLGLLQSNNKSDGLGHDKEASGVILLREWSRVH